MIWVWVLGAEDELFASRDSWVLAYLARGNAVVVDDLVAVCVEDCSSAFDCWSVADVEVAVMTVVSSEEINQSINEAKQHTYDS